jgi:hypothetical protein
MPKKNPPRCLSGQASLHWPRIFVVTAWPSVQAVEISGVKGLLEKVRLILAVEGDLKPTAA